MIDSWCMVQLLLFDPPAAMAHGSEGLSSPGDRGPEDRPVEDWYAAFRHVALAREPRLDRARGPGRILDAGRTAKRRFNPSQAQLLWKCR